MDAGHCPTFHVPTPIIADFRSLFDEFFCQAFGPDDPSQAILHLARLIYGLDAENAGQVLIEDVLQRTLEGVGNDVLQKAVMRKNFFDVADHYFSTFDSQTFDSDIQVLCDIERLSPADQHSHMRAMWSFAISY